MNISNINNTKIQCLIELYDSILMKSTTHEEVMNSMSQQVAIYLAHRNMNLCVNAKDLRILLNTSPGTIRDARVRLEEKGGFQLIQKKYYPIHIVAIISEMAEIEKQQQLT